MALAQNPAMVQALAQFMQQSGQNTAPLITPQAQQATISKPGEAATFGSTLRNLVKGPETAARLAKGDFKGAGQDAEDHLGWNRLKRAFGGQTVTQPGTQKQLTNVAPALYWGSLINQQQKMM